MKQRLSFGFQGSPLPIGHPYCKLTHQGHKGFHVPENGPKTIQNRPDLTIFSLLIECLLSYFAVNGDVMSLLVPIWVRHPKFPVCFKQGLRINERKLRKSQIQTLPC